MPGYDSVAMYRIRKLVSQLENVKGRGTELISLYVPPNRPIHDVMNTLREEYSTASNIKSDTTRNHVQDALTKIMQRLRLYRKPPPNGLAVFCGAIPTPGKDLEEFVLYEIEPPKPVPTFLYRCDDHFHVDILRDMLRETDVVGILSLDSSEASFGILSGSSLQIVQNITSGVGGKHRQGGQSARRFERLREVELNDFFTRVADHAAKIFIEQFQIKKLIISGPGPTKEDFYKQGYLDYRLQNMVIGVVDTSYAGDEGVRETLERAAELLRDVRLLEEKELVEEFLREASRPNGLAVYGLRNVVGALTSGAAEKVLVSEDLNARRLEFVCNRCGYISERFIDAKEEAAALTSGASEKCPSCGASDWSYKSEDIVDYLEERAHEFGTKVEVISSATEHGQMFKSFGGIGALLRYRVQGSADEQLQAQDRGQALG
ncbi:MAG: peptide chain release factor aRF-1 [Conexivisphaera sp.]